jgi:hypothetical protein
MNDGLNFAQVLWVPSSVLQVCLCVVLFRRRLFRPLPRFAVYLALWSVGNVFFALTYWRLVGSNLDWGILESIQRLVLGAIGALGVFVVVEVSWLRLASASCFNDQRLRR